MQTGAQILDEGRTPEEWCEIFRARRMTLSARSLRDHARRLGACHVLGKGAMLITPAQLDRILEDRQCHSNRTDEARRSGSAAASNTTAAQSPATTAAALAHLQKQVQGTGSKRSRTPRSAVTSLEAKRKG